MVPSTNCTITKYVYGLPAVTFGFIAVTGSVAVIAGNSRHQRPLVEVVNSDAEAVDPVQQVYRDPSLLFRSRVLRLSLYALPSKDNVTFNECAGCP